MRSQNIFIETIVYLDEKGTLSPSYEGDCSNDFFVKVYKIMVLTRYVEEQMLALHRQGRISFALNSFGEEGCAVAAAAALDLQDWIYPQYRELGALFWRGFPIEDFVHTMFGNASDLNLGRQMPNHFGSRKLNVVTVSSPIATQISHAAGCAYGMQMQKDPHVVLCFFGEGATSAGDFHAGVNFAAVRYAPVIFFCRNNDYAISTPSRKQFISDGVASKGVAYGVPFFRVDGNDCFAVYDTVRRAREYCLLGKGPVLIEALTYRLGGHSTADDSSVYRAKEEVTKAQQFDPVIRLGLYLEKEGVWNTTCEKDYQNWLANEVDVAIATAQATLKPPLKSIIDHVYFDNYSYLKRQYHEQVERFFKK